MVDHVFELARSCTHGQAPAVGVRFAARYSHFSSRIGAGRRLLAQRSNRRGLRQPMVTRAVRERCVSTANGVGRQHQHAATSCCIVRLHGQPDCHGNSSKAQLQQHSPQERRSPSVPGTGCPRSLHIIFLCHCALCGPSLPGLPDLRLGPSFPEDRPRAGENMRRALLQAAVATSMVAGALGFAAPVAPLSRCVLQLSCPLGSLRLCCRRGNMLGVVGKAPLLGKSSLPRLRAPQRSCRRGHAGIQIHADHTSHCPDGSDVSCMLEQPLCSRHAGRRREPPPHCEPRTGGACSPAQWRCSAPPSGCSRWYYSHRH